ncbi:hypothetical protein ACMD2_21535 [Ananas comosus]|uniref:Uncharacterized protein n=1 Tax=Ananas comosus TaxID=4615 RepID=A0A199V9B4_ANACO|nr:hypothetical protein ACMD2_21535 [Ananas comosus]
MRDFYGTKKFPIHLIYEDENQAQYYEVPLTLPTISLQRKELHNWRRIGTSTTFGCGVRSLYVYHDPIRHGLGVLCLIFMRKACGSVM